MLSARMLFGEISEGRRLQFIETLFEQQSSLIAGSISLIALAGYCWFFTGQNWLLAFAAASSLIAVGRVHLSTLFNRRTTRKDPALWAILFMIGAGLNSLAWSVAASMAIFSNSFLIQMVIICALVSYATVSAVRNHALPMVAFVQLVPPFVVAAVASILTFDPFHMGYSLFIMLNLLLCLDISRFLRKKTNQLIEAEDSASRANAELASANIALEALAMTDGLTGIMNRRSFDMAFEQEWARAAREGGPISLLLIDLDHFKLLNDTLGHARGDDCLRSVASGLLAVPRRPADIVARYGGEEFVVVLPNTTYHGAERLADMVRDAIKALKIPHPKNRAGIVSASVGFATLQASNDINAITLLQRADDALYEAKASGRDIIKGRSEVEPANAGYLSQMCSCS